MAQREIAYIEPIAGSVQGTRAKVIFNPAEYSLQKGNQFSSARAAGTVESHRVVRERRRRRADDGAVLRHLHGHGIVRRPRGDGQDRASCSTSIRSCTRRRRCCSCGGRCDSRPCIERLTQRFTMFREDGVPVRATLNVTFKEYKTIEDQLNPKPNRVVGLEQAPRRRRRTIASV